MAQLKIESRMRSFNPDAEETYYRRYNSDGDLVEERITSAEVDYASGKYTRISKDNGRTWSEWETKFDDNTAGRRGRVPGSPHGDELLDNVCFQFVHEQSGCMVGSGSHMYYLNGHDVGYFAMWEKGEDNFRTHAYFTFKRPNGEVVRRMFEFEEGGADYDPEKYRDPAYIDKNRALAEGVRVLPDGDLCIGLWVTMTLCCKLAGVDVNNYFPSCPNLQFGLIYARGHWNPEKEDYEFTYSNPIMLSDVQSSRGMMEPALEVLPNGRWLVVFRGSNMCSEVWNTRISPSAPGFKWYTYSDDGGKTFAPAMPWHFDTREVVYSPASTSSFFRSKKNGKLYWIGNIIDEPWRVHSNNPRWPLQICEVNEEHGYLIKDTLTVIETVRDGQTGIELSNFGLLEDRETQDLHMSITKINFNDQYQEEGNWYSEAWEYVIHFE